MWELVSEWVLEVHYMGGGSGYTAQIGRWSVSDWVDRTLSLGWIVPLVGALAIRCDTFPGEFIQFCKYYTSINKLNSYFEVYYQEIAILEDAISPSASLSSVM